MKFEVPDRVAIFQTDAILGLSTDQARQRADQLEPLGGGRYRVIGQNVKFRFREIIEIIDAMPAPIAMKEAALKLGVRFGLGVGAKTLEARMGEVRAAAAADEKTAAATTAKADAARKAARSHAARARE